MGQIIFGNVSSSDLNINIERPPNYEIPSKVYNRTEIPGRNGDHMVDTDSYSNVPREYPINVGKQGVPLYTLASNIPKLIYGCSGYNRLEDSYEPDIYMIAAYLDEGSVENMLNQAGQVTLKFDRKPQKYLKEGEKPIVIESGSKTFKNEYIGTALPIINVYGTGAGNVYVQNGEDSDQNKIIHKIALSNINQYLTINCEVEDLEKDGVNVNVLGTITNGFPKIPYNRSVKVWFDGLITKVEYIPRWWRL